MARTKQTARRSTGGEAPRKEASGDCFARPLKRQKRETTEKVSITARGRHLNGSAKLELSGSYWQHPDALAHLRQLLAKLTAQALAAYEMSQEQLRTNDDREEIQAALDSWARSSGHDLLTSLVAHAPLDSERP